MERNKETETTEQLEKKDMLTEQLDVNQEDILKAQQEAELDPNDSDEYTEEKSEDDRIEDDEASKIEKLEAKIKQLTDQNLRQYAEFDNYRKRTQREKLETYKSATADCALEFIAVLDNLERALEAATEESEIKSGVEMIVTQFKQVLEKMDVRPIEAENQQFNPALHNAINQIEDESYGENTVCKVLQKGYTIGEKVIRPAMVVVANP